MKIKHIYRVADGNGVERLVRTTHPKLALGYVARDLFAVALATQEECIRLAGQGIKVEDYDPSTDKVLVASS